METSAGIGMIAAYILVALPSLWCLLWWANELLYVLPIRLRKRKSSLKLPPGSMGIPFIGELLSFLWYFKILRRPDDFISSKLRKYGDGKGMFRTYLFGSPSIIVCHPGITKFVQQSSDDFILEWPTMELVGSQSLFAVQGEYHLRLRGFVLSSINQPNALRQIAQLVQPLVIASLQSWAHKGRICAFDETRKVVVDNIMTLFIGPKPVSVLETMDKLFMRLVRGFRATPIKLPGTTCYHALQCRKKLDAIFLKELETRKYRKGNETRDDLMTGLMKMEGRDGNTLSDQEVIDNIVSLVSGGYESTALATMWAIYCLAKNPYVLEKLREENMAFSKSKKGEFLTSDEVSKITYTNKVVEETIRVANIAAVLFRRATRDVEYKGYLIPKGWRVLIWFRYFQTNPDNFDDPMNFNPDRCNEPAKPWTYQVFGGGHRETCWLGCKSPYFSITCLWDTSGNWSIQMHQWCTYLIRNQQMVLKSSLPEYD